MSALRLHEAAKVLRERADTATPGPWRSEYSKASGPCVIDEESHNALDSVARCVHFRAGFDARYIATMHPGVGQLVAALLDVCADYYDRDDDPECDECLAADALADAILGGQS